MGKCSGVQLDWVGSLGDHHGGTGIHLVASRPAHVTLLAVLAWSAISCSTPPSSSQPTASTSSSIRSVNICLTDIPGEWSQALSNNAVVLSSILFSPDAIAPADNVAFGYFQSESQQGVAQLDLHTGQIRVLSVMSPRASGVVSMSYSNPWLAWVQGESQTDLGAWTVKLLNTRTGKEFPLAASQLAGGNNTGQLSFPVVGPGYLAWSQPASAASTELRVYRFDTGKSVTIDSGRLSSPVIAGNKLVWGKSDGSGTQATFRMADLSTLQPIQTPPALAKSREMQYLAGSPDYLVWTEGTARLSVYQFRTGQISNYSFVADALNHPFQFPVVVSHYLIWFTGGANTVVDLQTGNGFDLELPSGIAGADHEIVVARIQGTKTGAKSTTASSIRLDEISSLGSCKH